MQFSIIIPVYNAEKFLEKCVDSILSQTVQDYEIILINDGSTDKTYDLCERYQAQYNKVKVIHKENAGVSLARQSGIDIAKGEYVLFVDADDWVEPTYLEIISEHTGVDIIRFGNNVITEDGNSYPNHPLEKEGIYFKTDIEREIFPYLIQSEKSQYYCPSLWCHAFKRKLFVENMVRDAAINIGEDGACVIPCIFHAESMIVLNECIYNYNYNPESVSKYRNIHNWDNPEKIAVHIRNKIDIEKIDFREQLYRKIVHELFGVAVSQFKRDEPSKKIREDIINNIESCDIYLDALKNAKFKGSLRADIMLMALKYRVIFPIEIYSKFKQ